MDVAENSYCLLNKDIRLANEISDFMEEHEFADDNNALRFVYDKLKEVKEALQEVAVCEDTYGVMRKYLDSEY